MFKEQYLLDQQRTAAGDEFQVTKQGLINGTLQNDFVRQNHIFSAGVDLYFEDLESVRLKEGDSQRSRQSLYFQEQWLPDDELSITGGVRLDYDSWFGFYPTPKLSLRYELTPSLAVSSSYGLGYRAPSFKEMFIFFENTGVGYVVTGNPDLEPEKMRGLNLGLNYSPVPVFSLRINGYRNDLQNLITVGTLEDSESDGPTIFSYLNVEEAYTQGTELNARAVFRTVMITGGYALTDTKDKSNDRSLEGRPLHSGSGGLLWNGKFGTNASVNANVIGKRLFYVDINGDDREDIVEADAYTMMNVRLGQSFASEQIEIFTGINNALDAGVSDYLALRPRWYFVGLKGLFQVKEQQ